MLIPLTTDRPSHRPTFITPILIAANVMAYISQAILEQRLGEEEAWGQLLPWMMNPRDFHWYQPVTGGFLHGGLWHLLGNMLFLWVFGPSIEDRLGRWGYVVFYLGALYAAGLAHVGFDLNPAIGASGAIAGLTGAFLVMFPRTKIKVLFFLWMGIYWVSAWWFIGGAIMMDVLLQGSGRADGVAHLAHLGGTAYGAVVSVVLLWLKIVPREVYDLFSIGKQAYRRRQLKEAARANEQRVRNHWDRAKRQSERENLGEQEAVVAARSLVVGHLSKQEYGAAAEAYKRLAEAHADKAGATTLPFKHHESLAVYLYSQADKQAAAYALERLIEGYPKEPSMPRFKLLLGLLNSRELNDPVRAKALLSEAVVELYDEQEKAMAKSELAALG